MMHRQTRARAPSTARPNQQMTTLLETVSAAHPGADLRPIERAYTVAARAHRGQLRKSGDPYITHPIVVATIVAEIDMRPETICAALLHDTVVDTSYSLASLRQEFGEVVAHLVDGTVRRIVLAMARDPRVLVLKLADRLHNMRTMRFLPPKRQAHKARETLEVFAPLAHQLGMATGNFRCCAATTIGFGAWRGHRMASGWLQRQVTGQSVSGTVNPAPRSSSSASIPGASKACRGLRTADESPLLRRTGLPGYGTRRSALRILWLTHTAASPGN
jgi:hypothetical protein